MINLVWVVDDAAEVPLRAEHGLAVWVETQDGRMLLDTGGSGEVLLHNLAELDLDPRTLDAVVLSHAHDDHTGGLAALLPLLRTGTPLYAHPTLFRPRFSAASGKMEDRGLKLTEQALSERLDLQLAREPVEVLPGIWTTGEISPRPYPEGRSTYHYVRKGGDFVPDPYEDDLSLVMKVAPDQHFLLCGCCHAGLLNTLDTVRRTWAGSLVGVGGGVHLSGAPSNLVDRTAAVLQSDEELRYLWLGHCSGDALLATLEASMAAGIFCRGTAGQSLALGADLPGR